MIKNTYEIEATVWLYPGMSAWHFVTLPPEIGKEITYFFGMMKKGWGSLPVNVQLRKTKWKTSIFADKKTDSYLLPLKAEVRKKENISAGDVITFTLEILVKAS